MIRRILIVCGCLGVLGLILAVRPVAGAEGRIVVLAWGGPPPGQANVQRYRELADCGFTLSFSGFANAKQMAAALDAAQEAGVKLLVSCPELQSTPQATVQRFKDFPAVGGYFLRDEPSASDFPSLARWARTLHAADPGHLLYINLFPDYATPQQLGVADYQKYVDQFVRVVPVPVLSFDYYPIVGDSVRPGWYHNLEVVASAARAAGKPFWAFALSLRHYGYGPATVANLREQVFSDLAYGAQGIEYFTYWASPGLSDDAPINHEGKRTAAYANVKQVNSEIRSLSPIFAGAKVLWTQHTGSSLPPGVRRFVPQPPVQTMQTTGTGAVVSMLQNHGRRYLVIVNRDIKRLMQLTIQFDRSVEVSEIQKKNARAQPLDGPHFSASCDPGDLRILSWTQP